MHTHQEVFFNMTSANAHAITPHPFPQMISLKIAHAQNPTFLKNKRLDTWYNVVRRKYKRNPTEIICIHPHANAVFPNQI